MKSKSILAAIMALSMGATSVLGAPVSNIYNNGQGKVESKKEATDKSEESKDITDNNEEKKYDPTERLYWFESQEEYDKYIKSIVKKETEIDDEKLNESVRVIVKLKGSTINNMKSLDLNSAEVQAIEKEQDNVLAQMGKIGIKSEIRHRYYASFNGFSTTVKYKDIKSIRDLKGVEEVSIVKKYEASMDSSKGMIQAQKVWEELGYEGDGMIVAVVDTGINVNHPDMKLTEKGKENAVYKSQADIQGKLDETEIDDMWYTEKVPTGYDWADMNNDVTPRSNPHGMHVSGTVGANGDESGNGVVGVAPGVQIIAEKVFSDYDSGAYDDDIIKGIEHAVMMGADVINLSLGSASGFVGEDFEPQQAAIRMATEQGVLVVAAAGNESFSTYTSITERTKLPFAQDPDIGMVGTPSVTPHALSVASYENENIRMKTLKANELELPFLNQAYTESTTYIEGQEYEVVFANAGFDDDIKGKDFTGKIVVIYGDSKYIYSGIQMDIGRKGAEAVVFVPTEDTEDYPQFILSPYSIPCVSVGKEEGNQLIEKIKSGEITKINLTNEESWVENNDKGKMSYFSSWGSPHDLSFKPEISAPGGNIYSTVWDDEYEVMSGTSMASPHVAGGAALVLQSLKDKGHEKDEETALKAKTLLMNTSDIIYNENNDIPYSPRLQGSGHMKIKDAIDTPAVAYRKDEVPEKANAVELKEVGDKFEFDLVLEHLNGEKDADTLEYDVFVDLLTDKIVTMKYDKEGDGVVDREIEQGTLNSLRVQGAKITVNGQEVTDDKPITISVKKNEKKEVKVKVDLTNTTNIGAEMFVEGFVRFEPKTEKAEELVVPYMGFHGDWSKPRNIDSPAWADDVLLGYTALWDIYNDGDMPMGYDPNTDSFDLSQLAVSPYGLLEGVFPGFTVMRNLQQAEVYIEDDKGNLVNYITSFDEFTGKPYNFSKNVLPRGDYYIRGNRYGAEWYLSDKYGDPVPAGTYYVVVKTIGEYEGAEPQYVKMPITVDDEAPQIDMNSIKIEEQEDGKWKVSFDVSAEGAPYKNTMIHVNGEYYSTEMGENFIYSYDKPENIMFMVTDWAYNVRYYEWNNPERKMSYATPYYRIDTTGISENTPVIIAGSAFAKFDWTMEIVDPKGEKVYDKTIENVAHVYPGMLQWAPNKNSQEGTYTVRLKLKDKYGMEIVEEETFAFADVEIETEYLRIKSIDHNYETKTTFKQGENILVQTMFKNYVKQPELAVMIQIMDKDGRIVQEATKELTNVVPNAYGTYEGIEMTLDSPKLVPGEYTVKLMFWDSIKNQVPKGDYTTLNITIEE